MAQQIPRDLSSVAPLRAHTHWRATRTHRGAARPVSRCRAELGPLGRRGTTGARSPPSRPQRDRTRRASSAGLAEGHHVSRRSFGLADPILGLQILQGRSGCVTSGSRAGKNVG